MTGAYPQVSLYRIFGAMEHPPRLLPPQPRTKRLLSHYPVLISPRNVIFILLLDYETTEFVSFGKVRSKQ